MKKKVVAIILFVLAAFVLLQGNFGLPSLGQHFWPMILIALLAYKAVESLLKRHYTATVLTTFLALILTNHYYNILPISTFSLVLAGILTTVGIQILTVSDLKWWKNDQHTILTEKQVAFGSGTFYKQNQELVEDQVEVAFGNAKIYYDNAEILGDQATLTVEVAFGNATIYVPKHWRVDLRTETSFGAAKVYSSAEEPSKTLLVRGQVAFARLGVVYV